MRAPPGESGENARMPSATMPSPSSRKTATPNRLSRRSPSEPEWRRAPCSSPSPSAQAFSRNPSRDRDRFPVLPDSELSSAGAGPDLEPVLAGFEIGNLAFDYVASDMAINGYPRLPGGCRSGVEEDALLLVVPGETKTASGKVQDLTSRSGVDRALDIRVLDADLESYAVLADLLAPSRPRALAFDAGVVDVNFMVPMGV